MSDSFLPYGRQSIDQADIDAVTRVLQSDYLTTGPVVPDFEAAFADYMGDGIEAVACNSGTAALHLALAGFGINDTHVCIVPSITFAATANAVRYCGAEVVFADVDAETGLMTGANLEKAIHLAGKQFPDKRLGAVLPVHLAGVPCSMERLYERTKQEGAVLIADSCHALGSHWRDSTGQAHKIGDTGFCDAACFSFHPVKTIACGEGGMVTLNDPSIAAEIKMLRSHGIERFNKRFIVNPGVTWPWYHEMPELGWNYRLSDIHAALGLSQFQKLEQFANRRKRLTQIYRKALTELHPDVRLADIKGEQDVCRHLMNVQINFDQLGMTREDVMNQLHAKGIGSQVHYIPVHSQPYYQNLYGSYSLPGAEQYYASTLSLPLYPDMSDEDPHRVVKAIKEIMTQSKA